MVCLLITYVSTDRTRLDSFVLLHSATLRSLMPTFCARTLHFAPGQLICMPNFDIITALVANTVPSVGGRAQVQFLQLELLRRTLREAALDVAIAVTESVLEASPALCYLEEGEVEVLAHHRPLLPSARADDSLNASLGRDGGGSAAAVTGDMANAPFHFPLMSTFGHLEPAADAAQPLDTAVGCATSYVASLSHHGDAAIDVDPAPAATGFSCGIGGDSSRSATAADSQPQPLQLNQMPVHKRTVDVVVATHGAALDGLATALRAPKSLGRVRAGDFFNHSSLSSASAAISLLRDMLCVARTACTVRVATTHERTALERSHAHHAAALTMGGSSSGGSSATMVARAWQHELTASVMRHMQQIVLQQLEAIE